MCRTIPITFLTLVALAIGFVLPAANADQIALQVGVTHPTMLAGEKDINHVRISLTGFDVPAKEDRPSVNVAIVIDTSGSMGGAKIQQARQAAVAAINRLNDDDIVSVVLYNSSAQVLVPATKATDRDELIRRVNSITPSGRTALFAGVSKGAAEVRKFLSDESVNRVILLSDGLANVGPKSPGELERLVASLVKEGISVSTLGLGLGYNEDLMSRLASSGSGNHIFVEDEKDLVAVFNTEFNDMMSVVASDFKVHARVAEGVRPVRVLGTKADISGQDIYIPLAQIYARQQRYFVVEVEVEAGKSEQTQPLLSVEVEYKNMITETTDKLSSSVAVRFSDDRSLVTEDIDHETNAFCRIQLANELNIRATALRDAGQIEEAKKLLSYNAKTLADTKKLCESNGVVSVVAELDRNEFINRTQCAQIDQPADWNRLRKGMRAMQVDNNSQQTYRVPIPSKSTKAVKSSPKSASPSAK